MKKTKRDEKIRLWLQAVRKLQRQRKSPQQIASMLGTSDTSIIFAQRTMKYRKIIS